MKIVERDPEGSRSQPQTGILAWAISGARAMTVHATIKLLADRQDIALGVFEPSRFRAAPRRDAVDRLEPRQCRYSSNTTPRALSSATSASTSSTDQKAVLAFEVPAPGDGYIKTQEPLPHS